MSAAPSSAVNPNALQSILSSLTPTNIAAVPGAPNSPINQFITQENAANAANAKRGTGILQLLQGQGQAQLGLNKQNYQDQLGQIAQSAVSRGLNNTTVVDNLNQGAQNWLNTANEQVTENSARDEANMAASFSQQGPNMGLLSTLLGQGGGGGVRSVATNTGGIPGFKQPGSMLDGGGGGGTNVNNQAASGYATAMSPLQTAMNAAYGNVNNPYATDPYMNSVPMQAPAASQTPTGGGSLSINGQSVYSGGGASDLLSSLFGGGGDGGLAGLFS